MATETQTAAEASPAATTAPVQVPYRFSVRQFEAMIDAGVFPEGAHVELLGGVLVDKMTKHQPHSIAVLLAGGILRHILPPGWFVSEEKAISLGRFWRPEPDIAVVRGEPTDYPTRPPGAPDLAMIVEVSDTSYAKDRGPKWRRFASAGVPIYWIIDVAGRRAEVFTDPSGRGRSAAYRAVAVYGPDDAIPVVIEGREVGRVALRDVLPRP